MEKQLEAGLRRREPRRTTASTRNYIKSKHYFNDQFGDGNKYPKTYNVFGPSLIPRHVVLLPEQTLL